MYNFNSKQKIWHWKFTRKFEDKWSLYFLIAIPIIEFIRYLIERYGAPKPIQAIQKTIYEKFLPPHEPQNDASTSKPSICPDFNSPIYQKIFGSFNLFKLCARKRNKSEQTPVSETADLLADYAKNTNTTKFIDIESQIGYKSAAELAQRARLSDDTILKYPTSSISIKENKAKKKKKINMASLNTYDAFKVISTITMFIDHYGYFGLPGLSMRQSRWFRVIGRFAAPGFFFLAGWSSKKFRIKTWCAAVFTYMFTSVIPLGFVHSPWESIMNVALINCILYYIPPHRIRHWTVHCAIFGVLQYYRNYASSACNIGYGTVPFMLSIAGDLMKHQHYMRYAWVIAGMISFGYSSNSVFAATTNHTIAITVESMINGLCMIFFTIIEIPILDKLNITMIARDGLIWLSRTGLLVYIGHLVTYKLISMCYYAGNFNQMLY